MMRLQKQPAGTNPTGCNRFMPPACQSVSSPQSSDGGKVTDHHALIITENLPDGLSKDEQAIYDMVAARLLEASSAPCIKEVTKIHAAVGNDCYI